MTSQPGPRHRTRWIVAIVAVATIGTLVLAVGHSLYTTAQDRWAWRLADLDRNALHLLAVPESIEGGTVVDESSGHVVVKYSRELTGWMGQPTGVFESLCYRFTLQDPDEFGKIPCP